MNEAIYRRTFSDWVNAHSSFSPGTHLRICEAMALLYVALTAQKEVVLKVSTLKKWVRLHEAYHLLEGGIWRLGAKLSLKEKAERDRQYRAQVALEGV